MAKKVKWQIPFATNNVANPIYYRIDIFEEGYNSTPIRLEPGSNTLTTDEDRDEEPFTPIRPQSGKIQVSTFIPPQTLYPSGGVLQLSDILPANNISHPVRVVSVENNTETIEWQGFLSCEVYSQDYTSITQTIDLPVISILEAMDSIELNNSDCELCTAREVIIKLLNRVKSKRNIYGESSVFTNIVYSYEASKFMDTYIDMTKFYEQDDYKNDGLLRYVVHSKSCKEILSILCKFMGWCAREQGNTLYLTRIGSDSGVICKTYSEFVANTSVGKTALSSYDMADLTFMGINHKVNRRNGARMVTVKASLESYDLKFELPECPYGSLIENYNKINGGQWVYILVNNSTSNIPNLSFNFYHAYLKVYKPSTSAYGYGETNLTNLLRNLAVLHPTTAPGPCQFIDTDKDQYYEYTAGAFMAKVAFEDSQQSVHDVKDGLYCAFFPNMIPNGYQHPTDFDPSQVGPIATMTSVLYSSFAKGYIKLFGKIDYIAGYCSHITSEFTTEIELTLQFGDKYWNGTTWQDTACSFTATLDGDNFKKNWDSSMGVPETDGLLIPVPIGVVGKITLSIWPQAGKVKVDSVIPYEMFFSSLGLNYVQLSNALLTDDDENSYVNILGGDFNDDIDLEVNLASDNNNIQSPSHIRNYYYSSPASTIEYLNAQGVPEERRPELDLLNRMSAYYNSAREKLELEVAHPTVAPLPLLSLNGISPDTKKYLPIAESRKWMDEVCTITCLDMQNVI